MGKVVVFGCPRGWALVLLSVGPSRLDVLYRCGDLPCCLLLYEGPCISQGLYGLLEVSWCGCCRSWVCSVCGCQSYDVRCLVVVLGLGVALPPHCFGWALHGGRVWAGSIVALSRRACALRASSTAPQQLNVSDPGCSPLSPRAIQGLDEQTTFLYSAYCLRRFKENAVEIWRWLRCRSLAATVFEHLHASNTATHLNTGAQPCTNFR